MESPSLLLALLVAFASAKVVGELFERLKLSSVVGELSAGVIIGPSLLGWINLEGQNGELLHILAELGVIVLLFRVGLDTEPSELRSVGRQAGAVGILGVILPFGGGFLISALWGYDSIESAFVAAALTATSVGITAKVLADIGKLKTKPARIILGAAVIDDVLGLMILAILTGIAAGSLSAGGVAVLVVEAIVFVGLLLVAGPPLLSRISHLLEAPRIARAPFVISIVVLLGLSVLAEQIGLAAIVGAFLAGAVFSGTREAYALERQVEPVADLLTPFFFVVTGAQLDLRTIGEANIILFALAITIIAVAGKMIGGIVGARSLGKREAMWVGMGMVPRGEVGIVVASLALSAGVVEEAVFSAVLLMVAATTLIAPPILLRMMSRP